jgi:hypothetical protein
MNIMHVFRSSARVTLFILLEIALLAGCASPTIPALPAPSQRPTPAASPTANTIRITAQSGDQSSGLTVRVIEITPTAFALPTSTSVLTPEVPANAEPVIFIGFGSSIHQKCGHGDIIAPDGHMLRATPRILPGNANFLEMVPQGTQVDIIDCRIWTDSEDISWLAVRTPEKKLGWMNIQPDKFYVTVYPVTTVPPQAITGIPAGTTVAYVPPSDCSDGPVYDQAVLTSIGIDFIPIVGDLKGLGEAATGCDMVTGESLGNWRWLGLLGIIGLSEVALLRHSDEAMDTVRMTDNLRGSLSYSDEVTMAALRNSDTANDFIRHLDEIDEAGDAGADLLRYLDNGKGLSDEAVRALSKFEQPCSFSADTLVATLEGPVTISQIRRDDWVLGYDESLKRTDFYPVTEIFSHQDPVIIALTIGQETITTTPGHPFYAHGVWVPAAALETGDSIYSASGVSVAVTDVQVNYAPQTMYNLTVGEVHDYFVGVNEWLVHNACSRILRGNLIGSDAVPEWGDEVAWQAHHIIPGEFENHPFVLKATDGGWRIDDASNGIALPVADSDAERLGLYAHRGYHRQYSSSVQGYLDDLNRTAEVEGWDNRRAAYELQKVIDQLRRELLSGGGLRLPN